MPPIPKRISPLPAPIQYGNPASPVPSDDLDALGAYIFAGGFTVGVERHFQIRAHLEESKYGVDTFKRNRPNVPVFFPPDAWPLESLRAEREWDFVYGNPPCAAWSNAGAATKGGRTWRDSPLVDCTRRHFSLLEALRPKVWAWESVQRAWSLGSDFVRDLARRARDLGYSTTIWLHSARFCGAPQKRDRFFMIAHRVELSIPDPDWKETTIEEALATVADDPGEPLERNLGKVRHLLQDMRQGENLSSAWMRLTPKEEQVTGNRGQMVGRPPFTIKRARSGQPAPVVMHELVHPTEHRGLSIRELATLCGYPRDWEFVGANDAGQVGRGVCPPVGEFLARFVAAAVRAGVPVVEPRMRIVDQTKPPSRRADLSYDDAGPGFVVAGADDGEEGQDVACDQGDGAAPATRPRAKVAASPVTVEPERVPEVAAGEGSGDYIKRLIGLGTFADEEIVACVLHRFQGRKTTVKDVRWNRARMNGDNVSGGGQALRTGPRKAVDPSRAFDRSSLRANAHGKWVHRDYGAHFFRWGFAGRFVDGTKRVLDVGCGPDCPLVDTLTMPRNSVPRSYLGVDFNGEPRNHPRRQWATFRWGFDFTTRYQELMVLADPDSGQVGPDDGYDVIVCFEVIEHMRREDGDALLAGINYLLANGGVALVSTPVFDGKAAANHLHEWTIPELQSAIEQAGLVVRDRFGTFASQPAIRKVASRVEQDFMDRIARYYSGEVISCFLAPLYPDASRNNVWVLERPT